MHLTLQRPRIEQTLHQKMQEYNNLLVDSTQHASEDEAKIYIHIIYTPVFVNVRYCIQTRKGACPLQREHRESIKGV